MAFYRLSDKWQLCGWKKLPFAIQNLSDGTTYFYQKDTFRFLLSCDGMTKLDPDALSESSRNAINDLLAKNILTETQGDTLPPLAEYHLYPTRYRRSVQWSITGHCNYRCKHCFMSAPHAKFPEPTFEALSEIIRQLDECGIRQISLTGGEPLVRKDFIDIVDELLSHHINITVIFTNGKLVTRELLEALKARNIRCGFQISFDGTQGWHDWLRGVDGAYDYAVNAIRLCREYGFTVSSAMCIHKKNIHVIRESVNLLASLGVESLKVNAASPEGEWKNYPQYFLSPRETFQIYLDYLPQFFEDGCPLNLMLDGFFDYTKKDNRCTTGYERNCPPEKIDRCFICGVTRTNFYISSQGVVIPCMTMAGNPIEKHFCSLFDTDLKNILNESYFSWASEVTIRDLKEHNPECAACEYLGKCSGGCRATATKDFTDDYLTPDRATCEFFKGKWKEQLTSLLTQLSEKYSPSEAAVPVSETASE